MPAKQLAIIGARGQMASPEAEIIEEQRRDWTTTDQGRASRMTHNLRRRPIVSDSFASRA